MSATNPYAAPKATLASENTDEVDVTHPLSPKGRFARATYWAYSMAFTTAAIILLGIAAYLSAAAGDSPLRFLAIGLMVVAYISMMVVSFICIIRRLHDLNWSGWLSMVGMIPFVGLVIFIPVMFFKGTPGANKYGPPRPSTRKQAWVAALAGVVFFVGITAAIAIPAYQGYKKQAQAQQSSKSEPEAQSEDAAAK